MTLRELLSRPEVAGKAAEELLALLNAPTGTEAEPGPSLAEQLDDFHRPLVLHDVVWAMEVHQQ